MIRISITNFKNIIETKTYDFAKGELIHLTGKSGAGKSTVLCAFEWCLYGKTNGIKPRSKKDLIPKVEICMDRISIDRDGPDLKVITQKGTVLISDAAQGHILSIFGDIDLWKSCSYLEQGFRNSLLIGSGEEKLKILRDLTYGYGIGEENDPEYYLTKLQEHVKLANNLKKSSQAIYESFNEEAEKSMLEYEKSNNKWEESDFSNIEDLRKAIKIATDNFRKASDLKTKQEMISLERKNLEHEIKSKEQCLKNPITDAEYRERIEKINREISDLRNNQQFSDLCTKIRGYIPYTIYNGSELEDLLVKKASRKKYLDLLSSVGLPSCTTLKDLHKIKDQIRLHELYQEFSELEELKTFVKDARDFLDAKISELGRKKFDEKLYNETRDTLMSLKKSLTNFRKKKNYTCPECHNKLFMNEKESLDLLEDIDVDKIEKEITKEQSKIDELEKIRDMVSEITSAKADLETAEKNFNFNFDRYSELKKMELKSISEQEPRIVKSIDRLLENFIEEIDQNLIVRYQNSDHLEKILGSKFQDFIDNESKYLDRKTGRADANLLKTYERSKSDLEKQMKDQLTLSAEISLLKKKAEGLEGPAGAQGVQGPAGGQESFGLDILEKKLESLRAIEIDYIRFDEIQKKLDLLEKYEAAYKESAEKLKRLEVLYEHFKKLSVQPIEDVISCINLRVNNILERLFTDIPIQIALSLYRQSSGPKKDSFSKISVNLQVYHGNNNYPNINCLSGGEADRVSLALTLALAEIFRPPIVMLDECMASLDSELREICLSIIKSSTQSTGSTFIDICHESVEGYHDDVIRI